MLRPVAAVPGQLHDASFEVHARADVDQFVVVEALAQQVVPGVPIGQALRFGQRLPAGLETLPDGGSK